MESQPNTNPSPPPNRSKIVERILKLFKLGSEDANTTEHEMELATTKARELMARYNISMADVDMVKGRDVGDRLRVIIKEHQAYTRKIRNFAVYDEVVAQAVGIITNTRPLLRRTPWIPSISMLFVGDEVDANVAAELFLVMLHGVRTAAWQKYGKTWSKLHTSYCVGFAQRLVSRARQSVQGLTPQEQNTMALVLRNKDDAIQKYFADQEVKESKARKVSLDAMAQMQGWHDGASMSLRTKVLK